MKANVEEEFNKWFMAIIPDLNKTREQVADGLEIKREDLLWAYVAGWSDRYSTLTTDDI